MNKVAKLVCLSRDEATIFKTLAGKVEDASRKEDVIEIFDILSGKKKKFNKRNPICSRKPKAPLQSPN